MVPATVMRCGPYTTLILAPKKPSMVPLRHALLSKPWTDTDAYLPSKQWCDNSKSLHRHIHHKSPRKQSRTRQGRATQGLDPPVVSGLALRLLATTVVQLYKERERLFSYTTCTCTYVSIVHKCILPVNYNRIIAIVRHQLQQDPDMGHAHPRSIQSSREPRKCTVHSNFEVTCQGLPESSPCLWACAWHA